MNQIAVVNQGVKVSTERVIVLPGEEFDALIGRPGYHLCENGDLERREGSLVYVMVRQRQPSTTDGRICIMSNERDRISEYFESKAVSRGEFEALKRFGDYEQLSDGTLMRMEGDKEFRIYCEESGWPFFGVILTRGQGKVLAAAHERVMEKLKKDPGYLDRLKKEHKEAEAEDRREA